MRTKAEINGAVERLAWAMQQPNVSEDSRASLGKCLSALMWVRGDVDDIADSFAWLIARLTDPTAEQN